MKLTPEQQQQIKDLYHRYFKDSCVRFWMYDNTPYMWMRFYLAGSQNEMINGYFENDCFHIDFEINTCYEGYTLKARAKSFFIKPIFNKYNCYDSRDIAFRQVKGDFNKLLAGLDKFFNRLHEQVIIDLDDDILPDQIYAKENSYRQTALRHIIRG